MCDGVAGEEDMIAFTQGQMNQGRLLADEASYRFKQRHPAELLRQTISDLNEEPETLVKGRLSDIGESDDSSLATELLRMCGDDARLALEMIEQTWQAYDWSDTED
jgi:hypothetical protein